MQITEQDIREMVRNAVEIITEALTFGEVCRFPYRILIAFKEHALKRSSQRNITKEESLEDVSAVIKNVIEDFENGVLTHDSCFKVVDLDSCLVSVMNIEANRRYPNEIYRVVGLTVYNWDGKMNFMDSRNEKIYYVNKPSDRFRAAFEWNQAHQDLVKDYTKWMHDIDTKSQEYFADKAYNGLSRSFSTDDVPGDKRMERVRMSDKNRYQAEMEKIYGEMPPEDYEAVRDYDMKMDYMPLASKGSVNRDLRAMDLMKRRKDVERQRKYYGDKVKDLSDDAVMKLPKIVGRKELTDKDMESFNRNQERLKRKQDKK